MIRQFQWLVNRFGRRVHFALEWPRTNDGWNTAPVRALRKSSTSGAISTDADTAFGQRATNPS